MAVIVKLKYVDAGWHVRWTTPSTQEFLETTEAFKTILSFRDRRWDEKAFDGQGGWWVSYDALQEVGHLFANYQAERYTVEAQYRRGRRRQRGGYRQQKQSTSGRFARGQKKLQNNQPQPKRDLPGAGSEQLLVQYPDQPY